MPAIVANIVTNFALKTAVRGVDTTSILTIFGGLIKSPWAWCGMLGASVLLVSFMGAIRTLPLSTAYPILTALAILTMTIIEWGFQGVSIGPLKIVGLTLTILGVGALVANG